jgi:hypothetical protein
MIRKPYPFGLLNSSRTFFSFGPQLLRHLSYLDPAVSGPSSESQDNAEFSGRTDDATDLLRTQLLDSALGHVKVHGWSHAALVAAAADLKLSPAVTGLLKRCR